MMLSLSSSMAQGPAPAGLGGFLAAIGQVPGGAGEDAIGFDQLLADAPIARPTVAHTDPAASDAAAAGVEAADAAEAALPEGEDAETPAMTAANLLIALAGTAPRKAAKTDAVTAEAAEAEADAPVDAGKTATFVALPIPTSDAQTPRDAATRSDAQTAPAAASRTPPAASQTSSAPTAEMQPARTGEAAPSMTVIFTQQTAQGPARIADAAQTAPVAERLLDMSSDDVWIDQLARDIAATRSDKGDISFRLMPRHLGRLDVAMRMEGDGVSLKMDTQHEAAATIVHAAQGRLVDELRQQGVRVAGAEVTCTPGETGRQSGQGQGRNAEGDASHLIETASEHAVPRDDEDRTADRRGRFA